MMMFRLLRNSILFFVTITLAPACEKKPSPSEAVQTPAPPTEEDDLPAMQALLTTGALFDFKEADRPMLIILFQPGCDDCQIEAKEISERIDAFSAYKLYFMSSHPIDELKKFALDYGFADKRNVVFGQVSVDAVIQNFGQVHTPSVFIYDAHGKITKTFNGKTDVDLIISALQ
jgi:peroxiredoxin